MPVKSEEGLHISEQFYKNTYFPNIIGAIDGKHIRIIQPQMTGSEFFNYEKFFSVVLMAMLMYGLIMIINTAYMLRQNLLNIPKDRTLPNDPEGKPMLFCLVADEAFGLSTHFASIWEKNAYPIKKKFTSEAKQQLGEWLNVHLAYEQTNGVFSIDLLMLASISVTR